MRQEPEVERALEAAQLNGQIRHWSWNYMDRSYAVHGNAGAHPPTVLLRTGPEAHVYCHALASSHLSAQPVIQRLEADLRALREANHEMHQAMPRLQVPAVEVAPEVAPAMRRFLEELVDGED